jgi:mRNA interferase MazF
MRRGDICWADLGDPIGSEPGFVRPVLVIQNDVINRSKLATVIVLALTSNLELRKLSGCVLLREAETGLPKDSVANATQLRTIDRARLTETVGQLDDAAMYLIDNELRSVLAL